MVRRTFLLIFHAGSRRLGSNNFRDSSYKEKTAGSARVPDYLSVSYDYDSINVWFQRLTKQV